MNTTLNIMGGFKVCCSCKGVKPVGEFGFLHSTKDGLAKRCKPCARAAISASKAAHPDTVRRSNHTPAAKARTRRFHERHQSYAALVYERNRDKSLARSKAYREANAEKLRVQSLEKYREKTAAKRLAFMGPHIPSAILGKRKRKMWHEENPWQKVSDVALRRAQKKNATPSWGNAFFMKEAYHLAKLRTKATGFKWEVDHIIPLQSPIVCGLHVEHNLQVIPATLNRSKGNRVAHHG